MHQKIRLSDAVAIGDPGDLPEQLRGTLTNESLADLAWTPANMGFRGYGYWPVEEVIPAYDAATQEPGGITSTAVDAGRKVVVGTRAIVARANPEPRRVEKVDFLRLFTSAETKKWNKLRKQVSNLTEDDYDDEGKALLIEAEVALDRYEAIKEFIELDHAETQAFVGGLMVIAGIVTPQRAAEVLSGVIPT